MRMTVFLLALALALPMAAGAAAPRQPVDALFEQLRSAGSPDEAKPVEAQILAYFLHSGSPSVDLLMTRATVALTAGNKDVARKLYDSVTDLAPRYAEGWHRRGMLQSAAGDDGGAMVSLQRTVELNPRHFEALEQLGEMLEDYGDKAGALKMYRRAKALDPQYEGLQRHIDGLSRDVEGQGI
jgi:tetratricopeptide (TPR) repeat protein